MKLSSFLRNLCLLVTIVALASFRFQHASCVLKEDILGVNHTIINDLPAVYDTTPGKDTTLVAAEYPGGSKGWNNYVLRNLNYPEEAFKKHIQGTVTVDFDIDEKGRVKNIRANGPAEGGLKQEGMRLVRESGRWIPAKLNDKPVASSKSQPIIFRF